MCDQISDAILDDLLSQDPASRVAVETMVTTGLVHVAGEVTTNAYSPIATIVRRKISEIGYTSSDVWFDGRSCGVEVSIGEQSPDISGAVSESYEWRELGSRDPRDRKGAGDQASCSATRRPRRRRSCRCRSGFAHRLSERLAAVRHEGVLDFLRPDGKTQVTIGYEGSVPKTVDTVVLSTQHHPDKDLDSLRAEVEASVIRRCSRRSISTPRR